MRDHDDTDDTEGFEQPGAEGRGLWRRLAAEAATSAPAGAPAEGPDDEAAAANRLAAYLDGRLEAAGAERLEAELAASPSALEAFLSADAAVGATQAPPERLLRRAAALVPGEALAPAVRSRGGLWSRLFGGAGGLSAGGISGGVSGGVSGGAALQGGTLGLRPAALVAVLAAVLLVSAAGFELGRLGYDVAAESYFPESDGSFSVASQAGL